MRRNSIKNDLDGLTILRFAHTYKNGGGVEQYLEDVDKILLERNKVKIIRLYIEKDTYKETDLKKNIGQGSLLEIPMQINKINEDGILNLKKTKKRDSILQMQFREKVIYNHYLYTVLFQKLIQKKYPKDGQFEIKNTGKKIRKLFEENSIDLLIMHHVGTVDSSEVIKEAIRLSKPYIYINHFSNSSFTNISVREQLHNAVSIAGVTSYKVPKRLIRQFVNVSDGINMKVFKRSQIRPLSEQIKHPIIFYPARITSSKGQKDLIISYAKLHKKGIHASIVFAGRTDSQSYREELNKTAAEKGLTDDIYFLGQLNIEQLRDWYGVSTILAFPTYHPEGLPRILMESQAMGVPSVVYISGGTPDAIEDNKTGFLIPKGKTNLFSKKLEKLLVENNLRKNMGEEAKKFALKNFTLEALAERHEKLYLNALKRG